MAFYKIFRDQYPLDSMLHKILSLLEHALSTMMTSLLCFVDLRIISILALLCDTSRDPLFHSAGDSGSARDAQ